MKNNGMIKDMISNDILSTPTIARRIDINQWTTKTEQQALTNLLADVEGHIFVLDHMQNLALHRQYKEYNPVAEKYRPENRDVEHREECHHKSYNKSFRDCIPEKIHAYKSTDDISCKRNIGICKTEQYRHYKHRHTVHACMLYVNMIASKSSFLFLSLRKLADNVCPMGSQLT